MRELAPDTDAPRWLGFLPWAAGALSCAPLAVTGFPRGHDFPFELLRSLEYGRALLEGQLPPFWAPNVYAGYGSPAFLYYAPGFAALTTLLGGAGISVTWACTLALVALSFAAVWVARTTFEAATGDAAAARVGTLLWVLSPYLIGDKLIRNADAEWMGLALAPLALRGVLLADRQPRAAFGWLAAGLALAVLSHNLTALVVAASAAATALFLYAPSALPLRERAALAARIAGAAALGLGISAWFWLPALGSMAWVRPEELLRGKFDFTQQWKSAGQLFGYEHFFSTGIALPLALAVAAVAAWRAPASRERRLLVAALAGAALCGLLLHPLSTPLWRHLPGLAFFQFPWRLLGPLSFCAALAAALAYAQLLGRASAAQRMRWEIALGLCAVLNALPQLHAGLAVGPAPRDELARALEPEMVRTLGLGVTVYDEYLPRGADRNAWRMRPLQGPLLDSHPPARVEVVRDLGTEIVLEVDTSEPTRLRLARWAFPGWEARLAGRPVALLPNRYGVLEVELAAGGGELELRLQPPLSRRIGLAASVACALALAALLLWPAAQRATGLAPRA